MALSEAVTEQASTISARLWALAWPMLLAGLVAFGASAFLQPGWLHSVLLVSGGSLGGLVALGGLARLSERIARNRAIRVLAPMLELGAGRRLLSTGAGRILCANADGQKNGTMIEVLIHSAALDETEADKLVRRAAAFGRLERVFPTRHGQVNVHAARLAHDVIYWQIEEVQVHQEPTQAGMPRIPMLTIGRNGTILFMNMAARTLLGARKKTLVDVFDQRLPVVNEANTVITADGVRQCLVAEVDLSAGRREIYLLPTEVPTVRGGAIQFDELPVALLKVRRDGRVEMANRSARGLVGVPIGAATVMSDLMEGLGRSIQDWLAEAAAGHGTHHTEFLRLRREDREVFVQVSLNRVIEGETSSLIAVLSDATELKSLEAQFVQSQKMQAIGQLAGGVAHDFNNLLTAISGHCDLLLLRHDRGDPDYGDLVQINQNANRAAALVGQLLAFSRKQNLRPEVLDLRNTLADLTHLLNRLVGEKVTLELSNAPTLPTIRADKRQLEQVLMNLVVNARDAMPDGGEIRIQTEPLNLTDPMERDRVVVPEGRYVSVRVADDGVGIASDKLQKVFEPFFTTKRTGEGTGLGLSTAYGIVKQTGGYIFVDSSRGVGTVFTLLFPVCEGLIPKATAQVLPEEQGEAREEQAGVVMLVEDEAPVRSFASRALRLRGYTVLEAASGEEALDLLAGEAPPHVDIFVTDVIMPGLDGPGWVRAAREFYPEIPVIFVSGYAEDSFSDDQARIEHSSFLPKPFSLVDLISAVQSCLRARQTTDLMES